MEIRDRIEELERSKEELIRKIEQCEEYKRKIIELVQRTLGELRERTISSLEYQEKLDKLLKGRSAEDWIRYYDEYSELCRKKLEICEREIRRERRLAVRKVAVPVFGVIMSLVVLWVVFSSSGLNITGFVVEGENVTNVTVVEIPEEINVTNVTEEISEEENVTEEVNITEEPETNVTEVNVTLPKEINVTEEENFTEEVVSEEIPEEVPEEIVDEEVNVSLKQYRAVINRPVKWVKIVNVKDKKQFGDLTLKIPKEARNISVKYGGEVDDVMREIGEYEEVVKEADRDDLVRGRITGFVSADIETSSGLLIRFWDWFRGLVRRFTITGRIVQEEELEGRIREEGENKVVDLSEIAEESGEVEYAVEYYLPGPESVEEIIPKGKRIVVSSEVHYENILAYTEVDDVPEGRIKLYNVKDGKREEVEFDAFDLDENGLVDYVEWEVPSLSEEVYELEIKITDAEHLDGNREFVENIYDEVREVDGVVYTVPEGEYVRAYFERNLTDENFIDIVVENTEPVTIEVYEKDSDVVVGRIENVLDGVYYIDLWHEGSQYVFDMRSVGGSVTYDYIHDATQTNPGNPTFATACSGWTYSEVDGDGFASGACDEGTTATADGSGSFNFVVDDTNNKAPPADQTDYLRATSDSFAAPTGTITSVAANFTYQTTFSGTMETGWKVRYKITNATATVFTCYEDASFTTTPVSWTTETCAPGAALFNEGENYEVQCELETFNTAKADIFTVNMWCDEVYITFTYTEADNTPPLVEIVYPLNTSNFSYAVVDVNYTSSDAGVGLESCWWSNSSGTYNNSLSDCGVNITGQTWDEGSNVITVWANDTVGNENSSSVTFNVDTTPPSINIVYPLNTSNFSYAVVDVNYTVSDSGFGLESCWWSNSSGTYNNSLSDCGVNITGQTWDEGSNVITVWANDTVGNENSSSVTFNVDLTLPVIEILYPPNVTNTTDSQIEINYSASDSGVGLESCWWTNDSGTDNYTLSACGVNITGQTWPEGENVVVVYANDTAGNENSSSVTFNVDTTPPSVNIVYPLNTSNFSYAVVDVNYTASNGGVGLGSCWWSNSSGEYNNSITCGDNVTGQTWDEGSNVVTVWANDTAGNENLSSVTFNVDLTLPAIAIVFPPNTTNTTDKNLNVNFTVSDSGVGLESCWWTNESGTYNTSITCGGNLTGESWPEGTSEVVVYANDTAGNENLSSVTFTVDNTPPSVIGLIPSAGTWFNKSTSIEIAVNVSDSSLYVDTVLANITWPNSTVEQLVLVNVAGDKYNISYTVPVLDGRYNVTFIANDTLGNFNDTEETWFNATNREPEIVDVESIPLQSVTEGGISYVSFYVLAYDADGVVDLNDSSINATFEKAGEISRVNSSCVFVDDLNTTTANYTCTIGLWYWDGAGIWNVSAVIGDEYGEYSSYYNESFELQEDTCMVMSPSYVGWATVVAGQVDALASDYLVVNNTCNDDIDSGNVRVKAIDLYGEEDDSEVIPAANFTANNANVCGGTALVNGSAEGVVGSLLPAGNNTINAEDDTSGQEQLYVCLEHVPDGLGTQSYSTALSENWEISILLAVFAVGGGRKKKKKKKGKKKAREELLESFISDIDERLRGGYGIGVGELLDIIERKRVEMDKEGTQIPVDVFKQNIGAAEALCKYLRENEGMKFSEIARLLKRDQRTVWVSYKGAVKKKEEKIEITKAEVSIPVKIFADRRLSILESLVYYLRKKRLSNAEVAEILGRDQRNVWTLYSRALKKLKKE